MQASQLTFQLAQVHQPLVSVAKVCAAGHRVVFDDDGDGSYILNKQSGLWTPIVKRNGVYKIDAWVLPPPAEDRNDEKCMQLAPVSGETGPVFNRQGVIP